jgi:hypothetical protein
MRVMSLQGIDLRSGSRAVTTVPYVSPRDSIPQILTREKAGGGD